MIIFTTQSLASRGKDPPDPIRQDTALTQEPDWTQGRTDQFWLLSELYVRDNALDTVPCTIRQITFNGVGKEAVSDFS